MRGECVGVRGAGGGDWWEARQGVVIIYRGFTLGRHEIE